MKDVTQKPLDVQPHIFPVYTFQSLTEFQNEKVMGDHSQTPYCFAAIRSFPGRATWRLSPLSALPPSIGGAWVWGN